MRKTTLLKSMLLLCALIVGSTSVWADTTYKLTQVTSVSAGNKYVFEQNSRVLNNSTSSSALQTTDSYSSSGLAGTETYIWELESATDGFYLKNVSLKSNQYLNNSSSTGVSFGSKSSIWSIGFTNGVALISNTSNDNRFLGETVNSPNSNVYKAYATGNLNDHHHDFTVYRVDEDTSGDPVPVTGVSVKTATILTIGDTEKLIPTISPGTATDKVVSWESNTPSVATVDAEGNVSAVSLGTARITVTTHDGGYTANCDVTVVPVVATLDFTSNIGWGFPTDKTVGPQSYTNGYTVTLQGSTGQGYYFDTNNLLLGKNGAKLTLPAFPFKVNKIKVYGTSGASASVTFNVYVGDEAVSTSATSSKVEHEFTIDSEKQDAGTVYVIKVTNDNNMRISKIKIFGYTSFTLASACTDGEKYYGTFSCNNAFVVPEGITVSALKIVDGKLSYMDYAKDDVVPASTGVLVSSTTNGQKTVYLSDGAGAAKDGNMLKPSGDAGIDAASMNIADTKFYRLTMHNGSQIGFWWGAAGGAAFDLGANKAYLAVPETAAREGFSFENDVTGIKNLSRALSQGEGVAYNLAGQRVNANHKGLVIVNGKKYLNK